VTPINLLHDPLCPADSICDGSNGCRNPRSAVVLCQLSGRQNRGSDQRHALATLVHLRSLAVSPFVRYTPAGEWMGAPSTPFAGSEPSSQMPFYLVTKVKNKGRNTSPDPNSVRERNACRIGFSERRRNWTGSRCAGCQTEA
jgi:hypothetical protein